ncbi:MAG TPA: hypothetical protein VJP90_00455 [Paenarthrobacter sp.]|nr:hypothetical protein [Paenarthrobacter sp.]
MLLEKTVLSAGGQDPVRVDYDICHPARWSLTAPRHDHTLLLLGLVLTAGGEARRHALPVPPGGDAPGVA